MKTSNRWWAAGLSLVVVGRVWAVNPDNGGSCWRDGQDSTRQVWTFDTSANPIAPSFQTNQPGSPTATLTVGALGQGWLANGCSGSCGTVEVAKLPLSKTCTGGHYKNSDSGCGPYANTPPPTGDAQGFWDMGGSGGQLVLTIPNNGAPPGTIRYFVIQGTYNLDTGVAGLPYDYGMTNSAGAGNDPGNYLETDTLMEQPLDISGNLSPIAWWNQQIVLTNAAATAAGNDTLTIDNGGSAFWVDAVIVETWDRVAGNDALAAAQSTTTNIPYAQLLANDRGGVLVAVGGAVNGTVATNAGNVVTFTPTNGFTGTATFWYTNQDCLGTNLSAQVTLNVVSTNHAPVANPDHYTRPKGAALKIRISDLLANDTDSDGDTLTVTGISLTTTNQVHLATNDTLIIYTNSTSLDANDQFGYTISDGHGGTAGGVVNITVVGGQSGQTTGSITVTGSQVGLVFYGVPGTAYQVQRSTNGGGDWMTIGGATANNYNTPPAGQINYTDTFSDLLPSPGIPPTALYRLFLP